MRGLTVNGSVESLTLALFVLGIRTDDKKRAAPPYHPATVTHLLDRGSNLHAVSVISPQNSKLHKSNILMAGYSFVNIWGPSRVIAMVCSKWAVRLRSWLITVQSSRSVRVRHVPIRTMGSRANTKPAGIF